MYNKIEKNKGKVRNTKKVDIQEFATNYLCKTYNNSDSLTHDKLLECMDLYGIDDYTKISYKQALRKSKKEFLALIYEVKDENDIVGYYIPKEYSKKEIKQIKSIENLSLEEINSLKKEKEQIRERLKQEYLDNVQGMVEQEQYYEYYEHYEVTEKINSINTSDKEYEEAKKEKAMQLVYKQKRKRNKHRYIA